MSATRQALGSPGFIGLGSMGLPLARHLAAAGAQVAAYDVRKEALEHACTEAGIRAAPHPADLAQTCDLVFTCLPDPQAIRDVYLGTQGLVAAARDGLIVCELSTCSPELCAEMSAALARRGAAYAEAMMIGPPASAAARKLFFVAAGDRSLEACIAPALVAMGRGYRWVGETGSASRAKLLHNALGLIHAYAACEVLGLCLKAGIDVDAFIDIVRESAHSGGIGYSTFFDMYAADIAHRRTSGTGKLYIAAKDTALARAFGAEQRYPTPLLDVAWAAFDEALQAGWGEREFTAVAEVIERRLGEHIFGGPRKGSS